MTISTTQNDFREHINAYLDQVNNNNQTILITQSNNHIAAVISQAKLNALFEAITAKKDSLDYSIARDKLIEMHILPNDSIVKPTDNYWNKFKSTNDE